MERHLSTGITTLVALMAADRPSADAVAQASGRLPGGRDGGVAALLGLADDQDALTEAASRCPFLTGRRGTT